MARKGRDKKGNNISVDLSGVEVGNKKALPEGDYHVTVESATVETSSNSGSNYIKFEFEVIDGPNKGYKLFHNCSLQAQALFNLKSVLTALGFEIPKKAFDLDVKDLVGLECRVEVSHELYEGKKKARLTDFFNLSDSDDEDGEGMELEDLDLDQLKQLAEELEIDKKLIKKAKSAEKLIELIEDEADEDDITEAIEELFGDSDEDEDDEDEEDEDVDYEDMDMDELKAECKDRGIKVKKSMKKADLVELLEEDDEE